MTTPLTIDLVIKSFSRDYTALEYLLRSIARNLSGYRKLYIFLDEEDGFHEFYECIEDLIRPQWLIQLCDAYSRSGYLEQQLYKLNFHKYTDADFILPLDSDMIIFRESTVEDWLFNGKALIPFGNWESAGSYPPLSLHSRLINEGLAVRHNIDQMVDIIKIKHKELGCSNLVESGGKLGFIFSGSMYSLDRNRPHTAWLSSIRQLTEEPIDTMRAHYMFSREGIDYLESRILSDFGMSLDSAVDSPEVFPVFSEYQVYGNLIRDYPESLNHNMIGPENYSHFTSGLPVIKCNSRQESAYFVYEEILNGSFSEYTDRNQLLQVLRTQRQAFNTKEEWC